jgi:hypothetical protein
MISCSIQILAGPDYPVCPIQKSIIKFGIEPVKQDLLMFRQVESMVSKISIFRRLSSAVPECCLTEQGICLQFETIGNNFGGHATFEH